MATSLTLKRLPQSQANGMGDDSEFVREKLKVSDLPLSASQRRNIDDLTQTFKKSGDFDRLRKQIFSDFTTSSANDEMIKALEQLADSELERDPSLLSKNRQNAAALIEGAAERNDIYNIARHHVQQLIAYQSQATDKTLRDVRVQQVGPTKADEERVRGCKTDAEYETEFFAQKADRARVREAEKEVIKQKERLEKLRKDEQDAAREREREEVDAKRNKERDDEHRRSRDHHPKRDRDYYRPYPRRSARSSSPAESGPKDSRRERSRDRDYDRHYPRRPARSTSPAESPAKSPLSEQDLDAAALNELLKEGQKAAKSRQRPEFESDDALVPPPRKLHPPKSIVPRDPIASRFAKLDSEATLSAKGPTATSSRARSPSKPDHKLITIKVETNFDRPKTPSSLASRRESVVDDESTAPRRDDDAPRPKDIRSTNNRYDSYVPSSKSGDPRDHRRESHRDDDRRRTRSPSRSRDQGRPSYSSRRSSRSPHRKPFGHKRRRSRDRSPEGIDRYMPSTSSRRVRRDSDVEDAKENDRSNNYKPRYRDDRSSRHESYRPNRYRPGQKDDDDSWEGADDRDRDRTSGRRADRSRSRDRDRRRDRDYDRRRDRRRSRSGARSRSRYRRDRSRSPAYARRRDRDYSRHRDRYSARDRNDRRRDDSVSSGSGELRD